MALTKVKGSILSDELYRRENNLSDVLDKARARTNLGVYSTTDSDNRFLNESSNLSDLDNKATARANLDVFSKSEVNSKIDNIPPPIPSIWAGETRRFSFETPPAGFFALDGSTITNGKIDYAALANSGSRFITISGNNIILIDYLNFGRGKGSSSRAVGFFEDDAFQGHQHVARRNAGGSYSYFKDSVGGMTNANYGPSSPKNVSYEQDETLLTGIPRIASETRPKSLTELVCIYHGVI